MPLITAFLGHAFSSYNTNSSSLILAPKQLASHCRPSGLALAVCAEARLTWRPVGHTLASLDSQARLGAFTLAGAHEISLCAHVLGDSLTRIELIGHISCENCISTKARAACRAGPLQVHTQRLAF